jgi:hypothetical protein
MSAPTTAGDLGDLGDVGAESPEPSAGGARRGLTLSAVVGSLFALWGLTIGLASISDNGFLTHLATGRIILEDGIPRHDVYSFTVPGADWVVQSWLASVVYAGLDRLGGAAAIRLATGLLTAGIAALAWRLTRPAGSLFVRIGSVALVLGVGTAMWAPRPLLFGLLFLGITLVVVQEQRLPLWILLPTFWLWVNTHGSFPLGLVAVGCLAVGAKLDGATPRRELRVLAWAAVGTLLGAINPLGPTLLTFPLHMLDRQDLLSEIVEWQSPSFDSGWSRLFLLLVVAAIAAIARRPSWRAAIPLAVFVVASLLAARNIPVACLMVLPGIAHGLAGLGNIDGLRRSVTNTAGVVAVALVAVVVVSTQLSEPDYDLREFPVDAVAYLDHSGQTGPGSTARIAASDTVGNYLELLYGRDASVFLDDRLDMYPPWVVEDYLTLRQGAPGWSEVLERDEIDAVLWLRSQPLSSILAADPDWRLAYSDEAWVVYERNV